MPLWESKLRLWDGLGKRRGSARGGRLGSPRHPLVGEPWENQETPYWRPSKPRQSVSRAEPPRGSRKPLGITRRLGKPPAPRRGSARGWAARPGGGLRTAPGTPLGASQRLQEGSGDLQKARGCLSEPRKPYWDPAHAHPRPRGGSTGATLTLASTFTLASTDIFPSEGKCGLTLTFTVRQMWPEVQVAQCQPASGQENVARSSGCSWARKSSTGSRTSASPRTEHRDPPRSGFP